jgi:hypothetical protein
VAGRNDEDLTVGVLIEAHVLDDRPIEPHLPMKYPGQTHALFRSSVPDLRQARNLGRTTACASS